MSSSLRPHRSINSSLFLLAGLAFWAAAPAPAHAQAQQFTPIFADDSNAQAATVPQGYLGIDIADLDTDKAQVLRLKDTHGAVITLIDHDAPAGQIGLKVNDVVLQLNGQPIDTADQFRRQLKEMPPGRKVVLEICRDGSLQTMTVVLADRKLMEKTVWSKLGSTNSVPEMGILTGDATPSGFHMPSFGSTLKVGALVEPLTSQMAAYLGVDSGLMVKQVARKSEAEAAGFRAFDVILKVGSDAVATSADWDRALVSNQGKPVHVTILRDKKQQTLTLQVDSKHHQGKVEQNGLLGPDEQRELAELDINLAQFGAEIDRQLPGLIASQAQAAQAEAAAQALRDRTDGMHSGISPQTAEQLHQQTEKLRESMKSFQPDPRLMDELRRQMDDFRKSFNPDEFKGDSQQMQEFRRRMNELQREMQQWSSRAEGPV